MAGQASDMASASSSVVSAWKDWDECDGRGTCVDLGVACGGSRSSKASSAWRESAASSRWKVKAITAWPCDLAAVRIIAPLIGDATIHPANTWKLPPPHAVNPKRGKHLPLR